MQGHLKANDMLLQEKKPQGSFALGIAGGNAETPTAGLLRCPDRTVCIPKTTYGMNHQVLENRGALGLVQTCMMAATSQGARAPCEMGLGGYGVPRSWWLVCQLLPTGREIAHTAATQESQ